MPVPMSPNRKGKRAVNYELDSYQVDLIEQAVVDLNGMWRDDYSGRAMYGATCVGFDVADQREAAKVLVEVADQDVELARELAERWTTDAMGKGIMVYFPGVTVENDAATP